MSRSRRFETNISPEDHYTDLLNLSLSAHEVRYVVYLEFKTRNFKEERMLKLLYDPTTRQSAEVILNLESKKDKTETEINLHAVLLDRSIAANIKVFLTYQYRQQQNEYTHWYYYPGCEESFVNNSALWYPKPLCETQQVISYLRSKMNSSFHETLLLQLLLDPEAQNYVVDIMVLNAFQGRRYLTLRQDPVTSKHAALIFMKDEFAYEDLTAEEQDILQDYFLSKIIPTKAFGNKIENVYTPLFFLGKRNNLSSIALLQNPFVLGADTTIKKDIVRERIQMRSDQLLRIYLEKLHVYATLKSKHVDPAKSEDMIAYTNRTTRFIVFQLIHYFYAIDGTFSDKMLNTLIANITNRITTPLQHNLHDLVKDAVNELIAYDLLNTTARPVP